MKKKFVFLIFILNSCLTVQSQLFTFGGAAQLYWTWKPDIGNDCYEFTFENYVPAGATTFIHSAKISMFYWNECNYGKAWMGASDTGFVNEPLHITLYKAMPPYGIVDTFCGFDSPYKKAQTSLVEPRMSVSPHRKKLIYKGIVCLPEKCKWYFTIGAYKYICTDASTDRVSVQYNFPVADTFKRTNIDFRAYASYFGSEKIVGGTNGVLGCSFNNANFPNNSSVRFLSPALYYFPLNKNVEYNPGPYDPDHDSIVISLRDTIKSTNWLLSWGSGTRAFFGVNDSLGNPHADVFTWNAFFAPMVGQTGPNPIRYNAFNNPFDTDSTFHIVDSTGKTTFDAKSEMTPVLYYSAKDYRNNQLLSESYFFTQFTLVDDPRPVNFIQVDTNSIQGIISINNQGTFIGCAGYPISLNANIKQAGVTNGNLIIRTTSDSTLPGNGICTVSNMNTDSVHLNFSWTPPINARGLYNVYISAKDSNCTPPYNHFMQVYTWSFYVDSCVIPLSLSPIAKEEESLILYPNPANDKLCVSSSENFSEIKIFTILSELVYKKTSKPTKQMEVRIDDLPTGVYIVTIDGKYQRKLVKNK